MNDSFGNLIEPSPVQFTFGAPGWYVLGALLLLFLIISAWLLYKHYNRNKYRSIALEFLRQKEKEFHSQKDYSQLVYESNMIMKRIAMTYFDRSNVASLREDNWKSFLNDTGRKEIFTNDDMKVLASLYAATPTEQAATQFMVNTKWWIRKHKRSLKGT